MNKPPLGMMKRIVLFMGLLVLFSVVAPSLSYAQAEATTAAPTAGGEAAAGTGKPVFDGINNALKTLYARLRLAEFAAEIKLLRDLYKIITSVTSLFEEWMGEVRSTQNKVAAGQVLGYDALAQGDTRLTQAIIDAGVMTGAAVQDMRDAIQNVEARHEFLCKNVKVRQGAITTLEFSRGVSSMVLKGLDSMWRGTTDDGAGPQYAFDVETLRCDARFANPIDGYPENCVDRSTVGVSQRGFIDADLNPFVMDGSVALEVPPMVLRTKVLAGGGRVQALVPQPQNNEQRMWTAAYYYCAQLAGPRPTPLWGKNIDTSTGRANRAMFNDAVARQSATNKLCSDLLGYYSRPNASDAPELLSLQNELCRNARGVLSNHLLASRFGNCRKGLSQYQAEYIEHSMCQSSTYHTAQIESGGQFFEGVNDSLLCNANWNLWQLSLAERQAKLIDAVIGQQQIKKRWPARASVETLPQENTKMAELNRLFQQVRFQTEAKKPMVDARPAAISQ